MHYLARVPGGPIKTKGRSLQNGSQTFSLCEGGEFCVACQPKRNYLSKYDEWTDTLHEHFMATGDPSWVTCPMCKASLFFPPQEAPTPQG